ncbi:MAG: alpha/beta hydrolase [Oligoflexia bacterium]|nr:alpha/beta hydrolase [Oligoflexia bacterium]
MPFFSSDGFNMHYEIVENLLPMDTLFIHGNLASNRWWQPAISQWQKQAKPDFKGRAILAEWRGCGKSTGPNLEKELKLEGLASDYINLLNDLKCNQVNIIGHSTGGLIAIEALLQKPSLFHKALLLDPVGAKGISFGPEMYDAFTAMSQDKSVAEAVILGTIHQAELSPELREGIVNDCFGIHPLIWHGVPKMLSAIDYREKVKAIKTPITILHGEKDAVLPKEDSLELASLLSNGKFYEINGRGHCTNVEDPSLFVMLSNEYLFT